MINLYFEINPRSFLFKTSQYYVIHNATLFETYGTQHAMEAWRIALDSLRVWEENVDNNTVKYAKCLPSTPVEVDLKEFFWIKLKAVPF